MKVMSIDNALGDSLSPTSFPEVNGFGEKRVESIGNEIGTDNAECAAEPNESTVEAIEESIESLLEAPVETILHNDTIVNANSDDGSRQEQEGSFSASESGDISGTSADCSAFSQLESSMNIDPPGRERTKTVYNPDDPMENVDAGSGETDKEWSGGRATKIKFQEPIVSGYMPAKYYQRSEETPSREEMISLYRGSCELNRTKPLNSVISCLEKAKNADGRYKELSLKGERVDMKCAESLEVLFQHAQFVLLDLENCYLEDTVAIPLFEMIDYYEVATKLKLGANNKLSQFAWMHLCQLIKKCPFIELLDCSYTEMQDSSSILLARVIRTNCNLSALHLMNCRMSGKYINYLVVGLRSNYILQELYLGDNNLVHTDASSLSQLLKSNFKLQCLDLRNNNLADKGAAFIFEGLKEQGQTGVGLVSLILWNNNLSPNCQYVVSALAVHRSLETLNMGYNDLRNEGVALLKDGLLRNKSIARLGLSSTRIDSIGAIALAEYIAESTCIVRVDIRNNNVKVAGIMALQNALKNNYTLTRLDLDSEPKKEQLSGYCELYSKSLEQIVFLLERNSTLATEEDTRRFVLQQQMLQFKRGLASSSSFTAASSSSSSAANVKGDGSHLSENATQKLSSNHHYQYHSGASQHHGSTTEGEPGATPSGGGTSGEVGKRARSSFSESLMIPVTASKGQDDIPIILPPVPLPSEDQQSGQLQQSTDKQQQQNSTSSTGETSSYRGATTNQQPITTNTITTKSLAVNITDASKTNKEPPHSFGGEEPQPPSPISPSTMQKFQNIPHISLLTSPDHTSDSETSLSPKPSEEQYQPTMAGDFNESFIVNSLYNSTDIPPLSAATDESGGGESFSQITSSDSSTASMSMSGDS
ncbi:uncharacterized protein LOC142348429 isoform X2 [Convolutriloba macropyga]|uniref:uncharacterized protein LOC142348429 isoform X2 n=1 Tax=Convolutriloba macropyga TaxID=536237 RepID=UPI003F522C6C